MEPDHLLSTLQAVQRRGDLGVLCLDYILASVDYGAFIGIAEDFADMYGWNTGSSHDSDDGSEAKYDGDDGDDGGAGSEKDSGDSGSRK